MSYNSDIMPATVLHWNYRGFTEFPIQRLKGEESDVTDIYLKENLISRIPSDICRLEHLESLYLSGNDITELPREISMLRCLKCLDVSGNRLRHIPDEIGEVRGLKFLIIDENELAELPLRIAELRSLRYLSVCDNQLKWLPQRPVFNYFHCEFRFWRNNNLKTIPYSLWYHMFRDQQTRSLNIGCLDIPKDDHIRNSNRCRLRLNTNSREWEIDVGCPPQHTSVLDNCINCTPPSLFEKCKRLLYQVICDTAKRLSTESNTTVHTENTYAYVSRNNDNEADPEEHFEEFNNGNENGTDLNANDLAFKNDNFAQKNKDTNKNYVPSDVLDKYFSFLPSFIKRDLCNGPISRCENVCCKMPVFDYVLYEFCLGKIILIDTTEDVILSATFCSKSCADLWKRGKRNILAWRLVKDG